MVLVEETLVASLESVEVEPSLVLIVTILVATLDSVDGKLISLLLVKVEIITSLGSVEVKTSSVLIEIIFFSVDEISPTFVVIVLSEITFNSVDVMKVF